jgi:hypothetical protein
MIKVLVVVSGLALFVPNSSTDPVRLTALLLETQYTSTAEMPLHVPVVRQPIDFPSARTWTLNRGDFSATFKLLSGGKATINLDAQKDFPQLRDLVTDPQDAKVDPDCLAGKCKDCNHKKKVAAIVNFEGGWRTRPVQRCSKEWVPPPVDFKENAMSEFRNESDLGAAALQSQPPRRFATGLAFEAEIDRLEDLQITIKGMPSVVQLSSSSVCKDWRNDEATPCVVLEVENWPAISDSTCDPVNPSPECRVDMHFSMYYDLISKPPTGDRWLPYVISSGSDLSCGSTGGAGNPPGIRCPQAFALPSQ